MNTKITNLPVPNSIGGNRVINDLSILPRTDMFVRIPPRSFVFDEMAKKDFYLIKIGRNNLQFRNINAVPNDPGNSYPTITAFYDQKKDSFELNNGVYRQICSNGAYGFDGKTTEQWFGDLLHNKLNQQLYVDALGNIVNHINKTVIKYSNKIIDKADSKHLLDQVIRNMSKDSSLAHYSKFKKMNKQQVHSMIELINNPNILKSNRAIDSDNTAWLTFNTMQENITNTIAPILGERTLIWENKLMSKSLEQVFG